ncbi:hypothetical protein evm_001157 [Chilo suppressalis]|nr:hypothetical protein evm_001157 [Chilo suppressalis]
MNTDKLIECVKKYPILYDTQHENFTNQEKRAETWEAIASEMNERSEALRRKWKMLKYGYTKYKDLNDGKTTPNGTRAMNWCWGFQLQFLDNYNLKRKKKSKYRTSYSSSTPVPASSTHVDSKAATPSRIDRDCNEISQEENSLLDEIQPTSSVAPASAIRTPQVASQVTQNRAAAANAIDDDIEKILNFMRNKRKRPHTDAVDDLFQSYAKTFKKFSIQTQIMLKVNMAKLFADAELLEDDMNQCQSPVHAFVSVDCDIKAEPSYDVSFEPNDSTGSILADE